MRLKQILLEDVDIKKFHELKGRFNFQGHISDKKDISLQSVSLKNNKRHGWSGQFYVPPGGFWTSTIFKDVGSFKTKWQKLTYEDTSIVLARDYYLHAYTLNDNCDVLHIGSVQSAEYFYEDSRYSLGTENSNYILNWEKLSEEKDGLHLYESGLEARYFIGWEVESTVWFNPEKCLEEQFVWKLD